MRKLKVLVFSLLILLNINNIDASNLKVSKNDLNKDKITSKARPSIDYYEDEISKLNKVSISMVDNKYYLGSEELFLFDVEKREFNGLISLEYIDADDNILKSVYKKIDETKGYAHIYNEIDTYSNTIKLNFTYDANNDLISNNFKAGNGTKNFIVKTMETIEKDNEGSATTYKDIFFYSNTMKNLTEFYTIQGYKGISGKYFFDKKVFFTKDSKRNIMYVKTYYYNSDKKIIGYVLEKNPVEKTVNYEYFDPKYVLTQKYNNKGKIIVNDLQNLNSESELIVTSQERKTYYSNNKLKKVTIYKRNMKGNLTSAFKYDYNSKGLKIKLKRRTYKNGEVLRQYGYQYNKNGLLKSKAKRTAVTFKNKKAISAEAATYNKNGKLNKAKKIKITNSISKWN